MSSRSSSAIFALLACLACQAPVRTTPPSTPVRTPPPSPLRSNRGVQQVAQLRSDLDAVLSGVVLARGTWGVLVRSMSTGDTLYAFNPLKLLMPASNMKIVTLAAAAERLGWNYAYETRVFAVGPIESGVLRGDLVVVGSGDPSIGVADGSAARVFGAWADRLKELGIRAIDGRIVGDDRAFEDQTLGFGWSWDDLPDDYAAGVGALQFNENAARVTVSPGIADGEPASIAIEPPGSGLHVASVVRTERAGVPRSLSTRRLPGAQRLEIAGTIGLDAPPAILSVSVDNPTIFFVEAMKLALIARGLDVRGAAVDIGTLDRGIGAPGVDNVGVGAPGVDNVGGGALRVDDVGGGAPGVNDIAPDPGRGSLVAANRSAPLSTLAIRLMKDSQNQYAETLLKTLGAADGQVRGHAARGTSTGGRMSAQALLESWGVDGSGLIQRDGSGLSRYDYVNAETLVAILSHVYHDSTLYGPFNASLPVAGHDGTLANRLKGTVAEGRVQAKTGSMSNVRALSGYVSTADGEPLAFSILANNFETPPDVVNNATDAIVIRLAQFRR
jgi:D-alanyl-D-alanine carboxypeptidase/D-alanyl-D-alanine-endopeptidase (penicillin-binding protein 4)